jgi:hypothetical protein
MTGTSARNGVVFFCLTLLLAGGCGSEGGAPAGTCGLPTDGTRLKALRLRAEDGAWQDNTRYGDWYDSALTTRCRFMTAADGIFRCLPAATWEWTGEFADAACSQRIVTAKPCLAAPPQYGLVPLQEACTGPDSINPYAVHALGPGAIPDVLYLSRDPSGNPGCVALPNDARREVFPLLSEVPPTEFVAATKERTTGSRIQTTELAAADGARGRGGGWPFDSTFGTECAVTLAADGEWRCLPSETQLYFPGGFADMACTQTVFTQPQRSCDPAFRLRFGGLEELRTCATTSLGPIYKFPSRMHVHQLDAPTTPAETFRKTYPTGDSAVCEASSNVEAYQFSQVRAELPPAMFPRASDKEVACGLQGASGSRLKAHQQNSDDGIALSTYGSWVDAETGQDCDFRFATDGVLRCLPRGVFLAAGGARVFADAGCSQPLVQVSRCQDFPRGPPKFAVWDEAAEECNAAPSYVGYRTRVHALGAAVTPTMLFEYDYAQTPARCVPTDQTGSAPLDILLAESEFRALGSEVLPSTFVAATIEMP